MKILAVHNRYLHHGGEDVVFDGAKAFPQKKLRKQITTSRWVWWKFFGVAGGMLLGPLMRRLLEVVFDGKPEAVGDLDGRAERHKAVIAKERERLAVPAAGMGTVTPIAMVFSRSLTNCSAVKNRPVLGSGVRLRDKIRCTPARLPISTPPARYAEVFTSIVPGINPLSNMPSPSPSVWQVLQAARAFTR